MNTRYEAEMSIEKAYKVKDRWFEKITSTGWREVIELEDGQILYHSFTWYGDQAMFSIDEKRND